MPIPVIIPTITAAQLLDNCCASVIAQNEFIDGLLIQNGEWVIDVCQKWNTNFDLHIPDSNLGVAGSWNFGIRYFMDQGFDAAFVINDDIYLNDPNTLIKLNEAVQKDDNWIYYIVGDGVNTFSAYVITRKIWEDVGEFDDTFWPAYFEDNDYHWRMLLKGYNIRPIEGIDIMHWGSATVNNNSVLMNMNNYTYPKNQLRYYNKWGGSPGEEVFQTPFNGGNDPGPLARVDWERKNGIR